MLRAEDPQRSPLSAVVPQLEVARTGPEPVSVQAERLLYYALVGAPETGLVRAAEEGLRDRGCGSGGKIHAFDMESECGVLAS